MGREYAGFPFPGGKIFGLLVVIYAERLGWLQYIQNIVICDLLLSSNRNAFKSSAYTFAMNETAAITVSASPKNKFQRMHP